MPQSKRMGSIARLDHSARLPTASCCPQGEPALPGWDTATSSTQNGHGFPVETILIKQLHRFLRFYGEPSKRKEKSTFYFLFPGFHAAGR